MPSFMVSASIAPVGSPTLTPRSSAAPSSCSKSHALFSLSSATILAATAACVLFSTSSVALFLSHTAGWSTSLPFKLAQCCSRLTRICSPFLLAKMMIQCGLCEKNPASVVCCVDEAALCADCDARTHNTAPKKHVRVNLLTAPEPPKCDICQEKRGFFFCLEDRALLCRDCDVSIHTANALSCNHKRFLVTGTRVALEDRKEEVPSPAASSQSSHCSTISSPSSTLQRPRNTTPDLPKAYNSAYCCPPPTTTTTPFSETSIVSSAPVGEMRKSSFSEFLTDAVPGWRVDELLNIVDCNESFNNSEMAPVKGDGVTGDFDWTADLSLFEEQMFALHEVPQFPVAPQMAPPSSRSRHVRNNRSKQDMYSLPHHNVYGDAFIVPEIRMPSGPLSSPPFPKRYKRDFHH